MLVQLIRQGGAGSPAFFIGFYLSAWLKQGFLAVSAFLGALGSFFSGSTTVSNLTFGDIQKVRRRALCCVLCIVLAAIAHDAHAAPFSALRCALCAGARVALRCLWRGC